MSEVPTFNILSIARPQMSEIMDRMVAIEQEIIPGKVAKKYFWYSQTVFPYFTNRFGDWTLESDGKPNYKFTFDITGRLIIAHLTSNYEGKNEEELWELNEKIVYAFSQRPTLISTKYPEPPLNIGESFLSGGSMYRVFANSPSQQIGSEFTLSVELNFTIEEVGGN